MDHERSSERIGMRRLISTHSVLLTALILGATLLTGVIVSAADSDLDPSFDGDGIVVTDHGEFEQIHAIVIQPDGKIVAAGLSGILHDTVQEPLSMMVARYNVDGSLDSTFGSGGIVTTEIGTYARAWAVALQADGKIVVGGRGGTFLQANFALVRYNANGSLDNTFGSGGIVTKSFGAFSQITGVGVQADGKIVVSGDAPGPGSFSMFTVARYNTNGSLDTTFDSDGVSQPVPNGFQVSPTVTARGLALQLDQKIVVAGVCVFGSTLKSCTSRYNNSDGSLDNTFDGDGLVATDFDSSFGSVAEGVKIQPDGKIVVAGQAFTTNGVIPALARYNADGSLDTSFDGDGRVTTPHSLQLEAEALALQPNGKIVVVGRGFTFSPFFSAITAVRYDPNGSLDSTFGDGGFVTTFVGTSQAFAIAIQTDGRIVVGGYGNLVANADAVVSDFALVRYGMPKEGGISGGGWIDSPAGALVQMPTATGKVHFGFVCHFQNGANVPTGHTQFQFNAGNLNFKSTSYEGLVISGAKAQCTGTGTINGSGSYHFLLTVIDGDQPSGDGADKFRMRILSDSNDVIYDNQFNAPDNADPTTLLGGGNIAIQH